MGTRSLTRFFDSDDKEIACVYQQFDGYPSGVGKEIADFVLSGALVNGIPVGDKRKLFNGMGCLAAQFVAKFKDEPGGLYLYPPGSVDCGEEYVYEVRAKSVKCLSGGGETLFDGSAAQFKYWCDTTEEE